MPSRYALDVFNSDDESKTYNPFRRRDGSSSGVKTSSDKKISAADGLLDKYKSSITDRYKSLQSKSTPATNSSYSRTSIGNSKVPEGAFQDIQNDNDVENSFNNNTGEIDYYQDNSVDQRYYGGSSRTFNYTGGDGMDRLYDSPVSMATMGGYYDVDDSPAAGASFIDRYTDQNNLNQRESDKYYKATGTFDYSSDKSRAFDPVKMMNRIDTSAQDSRLRSDQQMANLFGDVWGKEPPKWNMPQPPDRIEDNSDDVVDEILDAID